MNDTFIQIAIFSGIAPSAYHRKSKCLRYLQTAVLTTTSIVAVYCYIFIHDEQRRSSLSVMDFIVKSLATLLIVNAVLRLNVFQHSSFAAMRSHFVRCNQLLDQQLRHSLRQYIPLKAILLYAILLALEYFELFVWNPTDPTLRNWYNVIMNFYVLVLNTMNWSILKTLRICVECLNSAIEEFSNVTQQKTVLVNVIDVKAAKMNKPDVQLWCNVHMLTNKISANYNQLFGWHIFLLMIYVMLILLTLLQEFLQYKFTSTTDALNIAMLTGFQIMEMVMIVKQCDKVTGASRQTTLMAYEAMHQCVDETDRKDVIRFAQQTGTQFAHFSAAGFFTVDNSVLFTMMQLITTYVIVLIQFQESKTEK